MMGDWIEWSGGDCPIKSKETIVEWRIKGSIEVGKSRVKALRWSHEGTIGDIIAYRIIDGHKPKEEPMTRDEIEAQIAALQAKLDAMPKVETLRLFGGCCGLVFSDYQAESDTHYFDLTIIDGNPHINGMALRKIGE